MSLFLRFASFKCPGRTISCVKRLYWTSHGFTFREGLRIRYFIPRTADNRVDIQTERTKDGDSMPEEFKVIYNFSHEDTLEIASFSALAFAVMFIYVIYDPNYMMELDKHKKEEENKPILEEPVLEDNYAPSRIIERFKTMSDCFIENRPLYSGDPRAKSFVGLAMIMFFFYVRSRCVLKIYRHDNDYVTVFYQALSFRKKVIRHKASDCCYYPKKKVFSCNLMGKNIIIFPELFVNHEERQVYIGRKSQ